MQTDRRMRGHERPNLRIAVMWGVVSLIFLAVGMQRLLQGQFPDPDDALRLVQVRDLLAGQGWFDLHQYRIDPPDGTLMHWSRLVDIPLALVILALSPFVGAPAAETAALIIVPLVTLGAILFVIGRLAWRLFDVDVAGISCLCMALFAPIVFQLQPMRIDHHGWQIFTVVLALWACSLRSAWKGGALAGLAMAVGATISLEILPMVAAFGGILALRWFRDHKDRWWLVGYMQALALGLIAAFFATRGIADLAQHCDVIAPAHLGFFAITAVCTGLIAAAPAIPRLALFGAFGAAGAAGLAFFGLSSPTCLMTPFAALDPLVRDFWYINVLEGRPLWEQKLAYALPSFVQLCIGLFTAIVLAVRSRDWLRQWWIEYSLLLAASILLSLFVWRSAAFAAVIAAIPIGWLATRLLKRLNRARGLAAKLTALGAIVLALLPSSPVAVAELMMPESGNVQTVLVEESSCEIRNQALTLNSLPQGTIFAPLDIGPAILVKSHHAVAATGHHRAEESMRDVILAFTSPEAEARQIVAAHESDYIVICTDLAEPRLFTAANPQGLAAQLVAGEAPDWLEPVEVGGPEEFRVWRVRE
ncbi:hypothetical protein [Pontixanthobacter aquaemixtae]|nr:hypothetical protein [Pontixanthobacter aquaemixtae]